MIGYDLMEIKGLCGHGAWLDWLREVGWKERTAENYIRVAKAWNEKPDLMSMGYSRTIALLAAPVEIREEVAQAAEADDLSAAKIRQLTQELKTAQEARKQAELLAESRLRQAQTSDKRLSQAQAEITELRSRPPEVRTVETEPEDYRDLQGAVETLRQELQMAEQAAADAEERADEAVRQAQEAMTAGAGEEPFPRLTVTGFVGKVNDFLSQVGHLPYAGEELQTMSPEDRRTMRLFTQSVLTWAQKMEDTLSSCARVTVFPIGEVAGDE